MQSKENYILEKFPNIIPAFFKQHQEDLGVNAKVNDLINNFDALTIPPEKSVYIGCLLPWEPNYEAEPNSCCFIREMSENANNMHLYMKEVSKRAGLFLNSHLIFRLHLLWINSG